MPFVAAPKTLCIACSKTVYVNEELRIGEGLVYHKSCFRCTHCSKTLSNTNFSNYNGVIYCKPHFMALFKTRGKYDDLAQGSSASAAVLEARSARSQTMAADFSRTQPISLVSQTSKKDLNSVLRTRNADAVQALIDKKGLGICFKAGFDGASPIEVAFTTGNVACGRVMLKALEDALKSGSYQLEKAGDDEEVKESVADRFAATTALSAQKFKVSNPQLVIDAPVTKEEALGSPSEQSTTPSSAFASPAADSEFVYSAPAEPEAELASA